MAYTSPQRHSEVVPASLKDLRALKLLADRHKLELGFVLAPALQEGITNGQVYIIKRSSQVLAFVHFRHRRDAVTKIYQICVDCSAQRKGLGMAMLEAVRKDALQRGQVEITLMCPTDLLAKGFYKRMGFSLLQTISGKRRALNIWNLKLR